MKQVSRSCQHYVADTVPLHLQCVSAHQDIHLVHQYFLKHPGSRCRSADRFGRECGFAFAALPEPGFDRFTVDYLDENNTRTLWKTFVPSDDPSNGTSTLSTSSTITTPRGVPKDNAVTLYASPLTINGSLTQFGVEACNTRIRQGL
jgi:hypothetical protein